MPGTQIQKLFFNIKEGPSLPYDSDCDSRYLRRKVPNEITSTTNIVTF